MSGRAGDGLNPAQRTAVTTLSGPLLVLAGAGTGKTRVITVRIAELIQSGITPSRILAVTFTNKAAREMRERAMGLLGRRKKNEKGPEISTFHSLCVRILRRHGPLLGYPENFSIYDRGDQESLARSALRDIRVGHQKLRPGDLIHQVSTWKSAGISPAEAEGFCKTDLQLLCALAYERYQAGLRASGAMDFDDLLLNTERLFQEHPEARFAEASRFDHLLIDEYQDTNGLQYRIVKSLADRHRNLCVVGDDDQSIYGWRGAEVEHILNFKDHWPEARVVRLEENYRCTQWIIHLANTLIAHNKARHEKVLRAARGRGSPPRFLKFDDETLEAESIVREIHSKISREDEERVSPSDIAILFRTNEQPRAFETELRRAGVPYILVGGQSFFDRKEVKDLLSYLRVLANPADEVSLLRIINTPARGIGTSTVQTLLNEAVAHGDPLWKLLPVAASHPEVSPAAAAAIDGFQKLIDEFRARLGQERLGKLVPELIARVDYKSEIERQYKDPSEQETRWNAVEELVNAVHVYESRAESPSLLGFLEETTLSSRDDEKDDDKKQRHSVTLMTLHSAKGLEFPQVYLVGLEEGLLPHKRSVVDPGEAIAEERRLAYVGVTRAKDELTLSYCKARMKWGKLRPQIPSRFLLEMRGESEKAAEIAQIATEKLREEAARARALEEEAEAKKNKPKRKSRAKGEEDGEPQKREAPRRAPPMPKKPTETSASAEPSSAARAKGTRRTGARDPLGSAGAPAASAVPATPTAAPSSEKAAPSSARSAAATPAAEEKPLPSEFEMPPEHTARDLIASTHTGAPRDLIASVNRATPRASTPSPVRTGATIPATVAPPANTPPISTETPRPPALENARPKAHSASAAPTATPTPAPTTPRPAAATPSVATPPAATPTPPPVAATPAHLPPAATPISPPAPAAATTVSAPAATPAPASPPTPPPVAATPAPAPKAAVATPPAPAPRPASSNGRTSQEFEQVSLFGD